MRAKTERRVGGLHGPTAGPTLLVVAGIHGNEPAGITAVKRVLTRLEPEQAQLRGDFVALAGNTRALAEGVRYLERDLNRGWTTDHLVELQEGNGRARAVEDIEQRELYDAVMGSHRAARGDVYFIDLHSTSAEGIPFVLPAAGDKSRRFALNIPLPVATGLVERVGGTLAEFMQGLECVSLALEVGEDGVGNAIDHHEAALWIMLVETGIVPGRIVPDFHRHREILRRARREIPHVLEVRVRYAITPEDGFRMLPGFANIEFVRADQLLAHDRHGEIRAPQDGFLMMPLYQDLGSDGFFFGQGIGEAST
jgi:succinylglutamate desuccinylase